MSNFSIPVTLEVQTSAKTGKNFICLVADLGYVKKRLAFGRDALEIFNISPREIDLSSPRVVSHGNFVIDGGVFHEI